MPVVRRPSFVASLAFAGALIWGAAIAHPSLAAERALPHFTGCAPLAPRFEPKPAGHPAPETAAYPGGAKLRSLVGDPCLKAAPARNV